MGREAAVPGANPVNSGTENALGLNIIFTTPEAQGRSRGTAQGQLGSFPAPVLQGGKKSKSKHSLMPHLSSKDGSSQSELIRTVLLAFNTGPREAMAEVAGTPPHYQGPTPRLQSKGALGARLLGTY